MHRNLFWLIVILIGLGVYLASRSPQAASEVAPVAVNPPTVVVSNPPAGALVESPLVVRGQAPGNWFFEGQLPIRLLDEVGQVIALAPAQAEGEWMTAAPVPFAATLVFDSPAGGAGMLVVAKDNPSGLPQLEGEFSQPVRFGQ